jgi:hypothetical protein
MVVGPAYDAKELVICALLKMDYRSISSKQPRAVEESGLG